MTNNLCNIKSIVPTSLRTLEIEQDDYINHCCICTRKAALIRYNIMQEVEKFKNIEDIYYNTRTDILSKKLCELNTGIINCNNLLQKASDVLESLNSK